MHWFLGLLAAYLLAAALVWLLQDRLVFPGARRLRTPVQPLRGVRIERVRYPSPGEEPTDRGAQHVRIAVCDPPASRHAGFVVFFPGRSEDLREGVVWAALWRDYGLGAVVMEYPGYGESEGRPNVESILAAARATVAHALDLAGRHRDPPRLFIAGQSLGTFPAIHVAAEYAGQIRGLLLRAPPADLLAVAKLSFRWLPVSRLLTHRFDALPDAARVGMPTLVLHGDRDVIAPFCMGCRLVDAFTGPTTFVIAEGHEHEPPIHRDGPFGQLVADFLADPDAPARRLRVTRTGTIEDVTPEQLRAWM